MTAAPPATDALDVHGGVAGITVTVEELDAAAGTLQAVAVRLAAVGADAAAVAADPHLLGTGLLAPLSLALVEERFAVALLGPAGAAVAGLRLGLLAVRLRAAAAGYAATETRVVVLLGELAAGLPVRVPGAVPAPGELAVALTDLAAGAVPGGGPVVARVLGAAGRVPGLLVERPDVDVTVSGPSPVAPPRGVAGLLARVAAAEPEGAAPGTVTVEEVRRPGGARAWVVAIPGTQRWAPAAGTDPFDATADVAALSGDPSAARALVVRALEASGARPGEPVLLAGHSLGGIVAAQLAADPAVRARFTVTCVVTAGAPVARFAVPAGVAVLSLEHTDDVVPALDGAANPDRERWLTVRRRSGAGEWPPDPGGAHALQAYARTAALVDASADPSVVAWREALAPFVAGAGVSAVERVAVGRRAGSAAGAAPPAPRGARRAGGRRPA